MRGTAVAAERPESGRLNPAHRQSRAGRAAPYRERKKECEAAAVLFSNQTPPPPHVFVPHALLFPSAGRFSPRSSDRVTPFFSFSISPCVLFHYSCFSSPLSGRLVSPPRETVFVVIRLLCLPFHAAFLSSFFHFVRFRRHVCSAIRIVLLKWPVPAHLWRQSRGKRNA